MWRRARRQLSGIYSTAMGALCGSVWDENKQPATVAERFRTADEDAYGGRAV